LPCAFERDRVTDSRLGQSLEGLRLDGVTLGPDADLITGLALGISTLGDRGHISPVTCGLVLQSTIAREGPRQWRMNGEIRMEGK
jgi:hypothetical protein